MKIHHFIIPGLKLAAGQSTVLSQDFVHQIKNVLKLNEGEEIALGDGRGVLARARVAKYSKKDVLLDIFDVNKQPTDQRKIVLYLAGLKRDNFEWALQKATEIGVSEIVPIITERTVKTGLQTARLKKIIKEAAEQSGQVYLPKLSEAQKFSVAVNLAVKNYQAVLFFDFGGEKSSSLKLENIHSIAVFIGPEGGWSESERAEAQKNGVKIMSLGESVLRAETAAIVASFLAIYL